jgi:hypothetical protein
MLCLQIIMMTSSQILITLETNEKGRNGNWRVTVTLEETGKIIMATSKELRRRRQFPRSPRTSLWPVLILHITTNSPHMKYTQQNISCICIQYEKQDQQAKGGVQWPQPPHDQRHRTTGKEPSRTPNKSRTGHNAKHRRMWTLIIKLAPALALLLFQSYVNGFFCPECVFFRSAYL